MQINIKFIRDAYGARADKLIELANLGNVSLDGFSTDGANPLNDLSSYIHREIMSNIVAHDEPQQVHKYLNANCNYSYLDKTELDCDEFKGIFFGKAGSYIYQLLKKKEKYRAKHMLIAEEIVLINSYTGEIMSNSSEILHDAKTVILYGGNEVSVDDITYEMFKLEPFNVEV